MSPSGKSNDENSSSPESQHCPMALRMDVCKHMHVHVGRHYVQKCVCLLQSRISLLPCSPLSVGLSQPRPGSLASGVHLLSGSQKCESVT